MQMRPAHWASAAVAVLYGVLGQASLMISASHGIVTPVLFLPEGVALAATLLFGPVVAFGVLAGQWALAMAWGQPWWVALGIAVVNATQSWIAWKLGRRMRIRPGLDVRGYARLVLLIFVVLQPYSATLGTLILVASGQAEGAMAWKQLWLHWWMGNAFAQALLVPLVLVSPRPLVLEHVRRLRQVPIALGLLGTVLVLTPAGVLPWLGLPAWCLVVQCLLLWIAVRAGAVGACLCVVVVVIAMLCGTGLGNSQFRFDGPAAVFDFNALLLGLAMTTQVLALAESQRRSALRELVRSRDLAEQARHEAEVAGERAMRADAAKGRFLASVSHELRTPLTAIIGFSDLLLLDASVGERQHARLKQVRRAGQHLLNLINDLLDLSRIEAGKMQVRVERVSLGPLAHECRELLTPLAEARGVQIDIGADERLCVMADPARLRQVMINLLSNAIKYNRAGGRVWLHGYRVGTRQVRVTVRDTGVGIADAQMASIFEPFDRGAARHGTTDGIGIGLAISRDLVALMGGSLGLKSQTGRGSLFWVDLSDAEPEPELTQVNQPGPTDCHLGHAGDRRPAVLCLNEDPADLEVLVQVLRVQPELNVIGAVDVQAAFEWVTEIVPSLVILDLDAVEKRNYALLDLLRSHPDLMWVPVVATSSYASGVWNQGRAEGLARIFQKPLELADFRQAVVHLVLGDDSPSHRRPRARAEALPP